MAEIDAQLFNAPPVPKTPPSTLQILKPVATQSGVVRPLRFLPVDMDEAEKTEEKPKRGINRLNTTHWCVVLFICFMLLRFF